MPCSENARLPFCFRLSIVPLWVSLVLFFGRFGALAQGGVTTEGDLTVFRTGGSDPFLSLMMPLAAPPTNVAPLLQFEFGFATDEGDVPETFFDSFSVTVQGDDAAQSALLLTADRTGVAWAPPNAGGIQVDPGEVNRQVVTGESVDPKLALQVAYSVSFILPAVLLGRPIKVFFDFFDNLNGTNSLAYVKNVRLPSGIRLQSATLSAGPFSDESSTLLDEVQDTFTLNAPTGIRFFRIVADRTLRIIDIKPAANNIVIRYERVQLKVESSNQIDGTFAEMAGASLDEASRKFTFSKEAGSRFFRVASEVKTRLKAPVLSGDQIVMEYEFNP
jgi:hypothetical protein